MKRFALVLVLLVIAGCGIATGPLSGTSTPSSSPSSPSPEITGDTATRSLKDVERFWTAEFPALSGGRRFSAVKGGFHPYTRNDPPPDCGRQRGVYSENAFYCSQGDYIAWDAQVLIPQLQKDFGPLLVGVVFAHEYGHAIQTRLGGDEQPTVVLEQQADCYAGAWLADVIAGHSKVFQKPTSAQLDNTVAGLLMLRDQPGTPATDEGAHGNAFDRIRALQDGVEKGAATCEAYDQDTLPVTEVPFNDAQDQENGGDLPYDQAVNDLAADAQAYWRRTLPALAGKAWTDLRVSAYEGTAPDCSDPDTTAGGKALYCSSGDFVAFDNPGLGVPLYDHIGDNAVGMLLGDLFARAAQDRRGRSDRGKDGQLDVDCLAGTWTHDMLGRPADSNQIRLSPGDLDEAVAALLAFGRADESSGDTAFERIAAYRKGVLSGLRACS